MRKILDLTGHRFGRLVCTELVCGARRATPTNPRIETKWRCICDCGNESTVSRSNLKNGSTSSCGCLRNVQGGLSNKHPLWKTFAQMHSRCSIQKDKDYKRYGARGIRVCDRWTGFESFLADMEPTHRTGLTLDRKDNNGQYSPENCRWATPKQQGRNTRANVYLETPWGRITVAEAAECMKLPQGVLHGRIRKGWTAEELFDPRNFAKLIKWNRRRGARNAFTSSTPA